MSRRIAGPPIRPVNYVEPGAPSRVGSASFLNSIIAAVNGVAGMRHGAGLRVTVAASGCVIELDEETQRKLEQIVPGGGGGSFEFAGEWNNSTTYTAGQVVCAWNEASMIGGYAGTYVCLLGHTGQQPPAREDFENDYWSTVARGHWNRLEVRAGGAEENGSTVIDGGRIRIQIGDGGPLVVLDNTDGDYDEDLDGKTFKPRIVTVCEDGETKRMGILCTETFT